MLSENNNNNNKRRNAGREQSSPLNAEQIKRQIEEGIREGLGKGINRETLKNIKGSEPIRDLNKKILEKLKREDEDTRDYLEKIEGRKREKNLEEAFRADNVRIKKTGDRQAKAEKMRERTPEEAEKAINKKLKEVGAFQGSWAKRKAVSIVAGKPTSEMAYRIAQKMSEAANRGGIYSIVIIWITLIIALWIDVTDIVALFIGPTVTALGIVSVAGVPIATVVGVITILAWIINFILSLTILFFWVFTLGGGHSKRFWKFVIRIFVGIVIADAVPYLGLLPLATFMVCWNWYDFARDKRKASADLAKFNIGVQHGKISKQSVKNYA